MVFIGSGNRLEGARRDCNAERNVWTSQACTKHDWRSCKPRHASVKKFCKGCLL